MRKGIFVALLVAGVVWAAGPPALRPGFNLFSPQQDVQLGRQMAVQVDRQTRMERSPEVVRYITRIGRLLAAQRDARGYPYTFKVTADRSVNAFSLPGGPVYVNAGLIRMVDNEGELAGVMAHEIAHVALRHGTNQASKSELIQLPAMLAGAVTGSSMIGRLASMGIGLGANSVLLKFSRNNERDADLLGARIMAEAGYNPLEMARFFEKLEGRGRGGWQFLSDHPNPGNRVRAVEDELRYFPRRAYRPSSNPELSRVKRLL